ncbi:hypothetical protein BaRGS_00032145 [Batillaria attramentaria]|uniref:DNA-repair protein Xrcc1 N-terminal domain-containing protein n=1 Tax=Batillaria attramentaria TaxID=370345 RepID=A0ABD0JNH6_9CAEN
MAPIKLKYVVSFTSQDNSHKVANLLEDGSRRWLSDPQDRSGQVEAVFQLEKACHLAYIDIGVIWCASIEVRVGKSDWPQGQRYSTLVPTQVVMTHNDSCVGRGTMRTCMFSKSVFTPEGRDGMWDRVQIICRQPWRKDVQLGLSFLRIRSTDGLSSTVSQTAAQTNTVDENGERKSVKDIQRHFFGKTVSAEEEKDSVLMERLQKLAGSSEGGSGHEKALPRMAHMVLAANHKSNGPAPAGHMNASELQKEVSQFLVTLDINKNDLDSVCVSDIRHKFEKLKWRKLTSDEKRVFYACCQEFIGNLFDESKTPSKTSPVENTSKTTDPATIRVNTTVRKSSLSEMNSGISPGKNNLPNPLKNRLLNTKPAKSESPSPSPSGQGKCPSSTGVPNEQPVSRSTPSKFPVSVSTPNRLSSNSAVPGRKLASNAAPLTKFTHAVGLGKAPTGITPTKSPVSTTVNTLSANGVTPKNGAVPNGLHKKGSTPRRRLQPSDRLTLQMLQMQTSGTASSTCGNLPTGGAAQSPFPGNVFTLKTSAQAGAVLNSCSPGGTPVLQTNHIIPNSRASAKLQAQEQASITSPSSGSSVFEYGGETFSRHQPTKRGRGQQWKPAKGRDAASVLQTDSMPSSPEVTTPSKRPKVNSPTESDDDLVRLVDQAISSVEGWLSSRQGRRGRGSKAGGRQRRSRGRGGRKSLLPELDDGEILPDFDLPDLGGRQKSVPALNDDDILPDLDLPGFTPDTGRAARGGRKRGTGSKRGTGTRGRGKRAASTLQSPGTLRPSSASWDSHSHPAMSTTSNVHSDGDRFEELTIDEDVVFVECPLCLQMFPSDAIVLHASLCCT